MLPKLQGEALHSAFNAGTKIKVKILNVDPGMTLNSMCGTTPLQPQSFKLFSQPRSFNPKHNHTIQQTANMSSLTCTRSPLHEWHSLLRALPTTSSLPTRRTLTMQHRQTTAKPLVVPRRRTDSKLSGTFPPPSHSNLANNTTAPPKQQPLKSYPPPPLPTPLPAPHTHPLTYLNDLHITTTLDPTGSRTRLFSRDNVDTPRVGDILLVTFTSGDPFSGVCLNIRRRGPDTGVLLRNRLLMVGTEMWVKVFSPRVR